MAGHGPRDLWSSRIRLAATFDGGGPPAPPATSVQAELPGGLSTALKSASIVDEHRALMGAVIEKIQSAQSGLNESCLSLIKGFEVCF